MEGHRLFIQITRVTQFRRNSIFITNSLLYSILKFTNEIYRGSYSYSCMVPQKTYIIYLRHVVTQIANMYLSRNLAGNTLREVHNIGSQKPNREPTAFWGVVSHCPSEVKPNSSDAGEQ